MKWTGNNLYTILPTQRAVDTFHQQQLDQLKLEATRRRVYQRQEYFAGKLRKPLKRSALRADVTCRASLVTPAFILLALRAFKSGILGRPSFEYRKQGSAGPAHETGHQAKNRAVVQGSGLPQHEPVRGAGGEFLRGSPGCGHSSSASLAARTFCSKGIRPFVFLTLRTLSALRRRISSSVSS